MVSSAPSVPFFGAPRPSPGRCCRWSLCLQWSDRFLPHEWCPPPDAWFLRGIQERTFTITGLSFFIKRVRFFFKNELSGAALITRGSTNYRWKLQSPPKVWLSQICLVSIMESSKNLWLSSSQKLSTQIKPRLKQPTETCACGLNQKSKKGEKSD